MNTENLTDTQYELLRITVQLKLLAEKREFFLAELEKIERECMKEEKNLDNLIESVFK